MRRVANARSEILFLKSNLHRLLLQSVRMSGGAFYGESVTQWHFQVH